MYVIASPCIVNPELRARGITRKEDLEWYDRALERCRKFNLDIVVLPCPETLYLGPDRQPATFSDRLDTPQFVRLLDTLEARVRETIVERGPPVCMIGVNSSPCCGVNAHYFGPAGSVQPKRPGRGVFLSRFPDIPAVDVADFARYRVYLAAPLFSAAEKEYNMRLFDLLTSHFYDVYMPQQVGDDTVLRDHDAHREIFRRHRCALDTSDIVVAVIDGADADSGTAWEMGYAYARGIAVLAIRTDFRMAGHYEHVNLMLEESSLVVRSTDELLSALGAIPVQGKGSKC